MTRVYDRIICEVAHNRDVMMRDIFGRDRSAVITEARQECYAGLEDAGLSIGQIAAIFDRDPTTISHGIKQHRSRANMILAPRTKDEIAAASALASHDDEVIFDAIVRLHSKLLPIRIERLERAAGYAQGNRVRMAMNRLIDKSLVEEAPSNQNSSSYSGLFRLTEAGKAKAGVV